MIRARVLLVPASAIAVAAACGGSADAPAGCVNVDLSTYDTSCNQDADCTLVLEGKVCSTPPGGCFCGGNAPVNISERARWEQATASLKFASCPCPPGATPVARCIQHACTACAFFLQDAGCSDGV